MKIALTFCRMPNTVQATPGDHDMFILLGAGGTSVKNWWVSWCFMFCLITMARKNEKIYATNHVTIVHNWKSCSRCHSMFVPKRVWTGTCIRRLKNLCSVGRAHGIFSTSHPRQTITKNWSQSLFISQHSDPSGVLVLHLNKGVGQGHSSLAQSIGTSFGSKESNRSARLSVWKQRGGSFGGCPTHPPWDSLEPKMRWASSYFQEPKKELFRVSVGKGYVVYIPRVCSLDLSPDQSDK